MPSLDDYAGVQPNQPQEALGMQPEPEPIQQRFALPEWIKAETGPGSIEEYVQHPLNFNSSREVAQVLRGLTGMFDRLNYAVIDVVMGVLRMGRKKPPIDVGGHGL